MYLLDVGGVFLLSKFLKSFVFFVALLVVSGCAKLDSTIAFLEDETLPFVLDYGSELPDFSDYVRILQDDAILPSSELLIDDSEATTDIIGSFNVFYRYSSNKSDYEHVVMFYVEDRTPPAITPRVSSLSIEVGDGFPSLTALIEATDNHDGLIEITDAMVDVSSVDLDRTGNYFIDYVVSDSFGNNTMHRLMVHVHDSTPPVVTSSSFLLRFELGTTSFDFSKWMNASDNYDGILTITEDSMVSDDFNSQQAGIYDVEFHIYDSSGNKSVFPIQIEIFIKDTLNHFRLDHYQTIASVADFSGSLTKTGSPKLLVLPIDFSSRPGTSKELNDLQKAFFGTSQETGWESVKSYYEKSSYGNLVLDGDVLPWYRASRTPAYYEDRYDGDGDYLLLREALTHHSKTHDLSLYDSDLDGYIDAIYLIYSLDYDDTSDLWWAYQYTYDGFETYDGVQANYYVFASLAFIRDEAFGINARTYIHETGHVLGLDDYYDYNPRRGPKGGLGGADMMDDTIGDHASISKLLLGWVQPFVATHSTTVSLSSFPMTGDLLLVIPQWNGTIFDEYFLIDFYTSEGLNAFDQVFSISGVRIYHVIAKLGSGGAGGEYYSYFNYDNSDTNYKFVRLLEADGGNDILNDEPATDSDLFQSGQTVSLALYNQSPFASLSVQIVDGKAIITITKIQ